MAGVEVIEETLNVVETLLVVVGKNAVELAFAVGVFFLGDRRWERAVKSGLRLTEAQTNRLRDNLQYTALRGPMAFLSIELLAQTYLTVEWGLAFNLAAGMSGLLLAIFVYLYWIEASGFRSRRAAAFQAMQQNGELRLTEEGKPVKPGLFVRAFDSLPVVAVAAKIVVQVVAEFFG